ncbi:MAG TPA: hypothetical protein PLA25_07345, partial [Anaerolineaceae bacterium]|nr:hypothetical protein [Anaerolineaceae bacterium]
ADLYYEAIDKWSNGDKDALTKFHDEHPEYEARVMSLKDPEARLHSYLVAEVWDRWNSADRITRKAAQEEFGDLFDTAFLSKETRSYDAISDETLAYWAKMLGADLVEGAPNVPDGTALHVPPPELRAEVDSFYEERDAKFPGIGPWLGVSANMPEGQSLEMPEIDEYYTWRTDWLADHPDAIPYILGDSNDLSGLPNTIQATVFQYRSLRQNMFPDIFDLQERYYAIASGDRAGRKAFREAHPELAAYWEFRKAYASQNPTAAAYILGEDSLADLIAGGGSGAGGNAVVEPVELTAFSPELQGALIRWAYAGEPLGEGAWAELRAEWEAQGQPGGTLAKWMEDGIKAGMGL